MRKELALGMMRLPTTPDGKIDFEQTNRLVDYFLEQGFRKFDTAELYHDTQSEHAIRECIVKRHDRTAYEIADKLTSWRIPEGSTAEQFFQKQLQVTGLDYFDRYLIHSLEAVSGKKMAITYTPRRAGDIAACYADPTKAKTGLGWEAKLGVEKMCEDAWNYAIKHQ